jgi:4'-phosphopantetheinyl transferase
MAEVLVLAGATDRVHATWADPGALLAGYERDRAASFRFPRDAADFVAAHVLVRLAAAEVLGTTAERLTLAQRCERCGGPHGRPSIVESPDLAVSLSHTRGYVAAAAGSGPLGVDVEASPLRGAELPRSVLAPAERAAVAAAEDPGAAYMALWVRKEALVKAGRATLDALDGVDLAANPGAYHDLRLTGWQAPQGFVGACAASEPALVRLVGPALGQPDRLGPA